MTDLIKQIANLPPEKRKLLEQMLRQKGVDLSKSMILPQGREKNTFPVSFAQQRLWFMDQMEPGNPSYNVPIAVRLTGSLDLLALEHSFDEIIRRHEILRTTFRSVEGQPVQVIGPCFHLSIPLVDLQGFPAEKREDEALRLAAEEAALPFDLQNGPLVRATILKLAEKDHITFLTLHHIVSDGWSMGVLLGELAALYNAYSNNRPSPMPDLSIQYADFSIWQRQWLAGDVLDEQLNYWKEQLGGDLPVLELPADHPRPAIPSYRGDTYDFQLPVELLERLKQIAQQENVTLFQAFLSAFYVFLNRHSTQDNICVGTPIANRTRAELEPLIGFFVNTLPMRADLSGDPSFRELLKRVKEITLGAYAHQDLPFESLVEVIQPDRNANYSPIFQVMFTLQDASPKVPTPGSLRMEELPIHSGTSKFDLTLILTTSSRDFGGQFEFSLDLFTKETVERFAKHFAVLLKSITANPDQPVSKLPMVTEAEYRQLVYGWNNSRNDYPARATITQLFEEWADANPSTPALVHGQRMLTYAELDRQANQLAHHLIALGAQKETLVGLYMEKSIEMLIAIMGALKAGCVYLPLDPHHPDERLNVIYEDSGLQFIVTTSDLKKKWSDPDGNLRVIDLKSEGWKKTVLDTRKGLPEIEPSQLAYVLYTSGSTGKPKGVMIEHKNVVAFLSAYRQLSPDTPPYSGTTVSSFGFDVTIWEFFENLCHGGTLHILDSEDVTDPVRFAHYLVDQQIDIAFISPGILLDVIIELEKFKGKINLKAAMVGVEPIKQSTLQRFQDLVPGLVIINGYGPTETTVCATWLKFEHAVEPNRRTPIGMPVAGYDVYVVEKSMLPAPVGVTGEIIIGGPCMARGYLNDAEMTDRKFTPHPFYENSGKKVYRTGDLARRLPDGNIEFIGRVDNQIKIRGFRVELGEIEAAITKHPAVRAVVVMARDDIGAVDGQPGVRRLVAYVTLVDESKATVGELRKFVQSKVPEYMVPSAFVIMETFPVNINGKIDRKALPVPQVTDLDLGHGYIPPAGPVEELMAGIWKQILGVSRVGALDNFFEIGGHSLIATQMVSRIRDAFHVEIPLRQLFETPTIRDLARIIDTSSNGKQLRPAITLVPRNGELPLSFTQQRLWFINEFERGSSLYNVPTAIRMTGNLDIMAFDMSLNEIVHRHETLRTVFKTVDGKPALVIQNEMFLPLPVIDLTHLVPADQEEEIDRLAREEAEKPFNLAEGPLMRVTLLRLNAQTHIILFTLHHIVTDGWSMGILINELAQLYGAFTQNQPSPLVDLPIQYVDYAAWQKEWLSGETLEQELNFWKQQLEDIPASLDLPTDRPRPPVITNNGSEFVFSLPDELSKAIKEFSLKEGSTLFMTLLAAFQVLLYRYSGQEDICVGTPVANRTTAEVENLIGFFVNTLVLRGKLSSGMDFRTLLKQVRDTSLGAFAHQEMPFEKLVDVIQPDRDMSRSPLFQVMFILQNAPLSSIDLPGIKLEEVAIHTHQSMFDITLALEETESGISGAFEYNTDLFDPSTIERMAEHYRILLQSIVSTPDEKVVRLPVISEKERNRILYEWNQTRVENRLGAYCIHQIVEMQAAKTPDALAVSFQRSTLTYAELNQRANQLAHFLRKLGVQPGVRVGICVERSLEMIFGLLGILKSGGAYLPLDPVYPAERLAFMVSDADVHIILTQQDLRANLPEDGIQKFYLDSGWKEIAAESDANPTSGVQISDPAYVIYTSGSTGTPKGVIVPHRGVVNHNLMMVKAFKLTPNDRVLQFATINFDTAVEEIFPTLMSGAALILRPDKQLSTGEQLMQLIREEQLTVLDLPTAYWHEWVSELTDSPVPLPAYLRLVVVGGEKALPERYADWLRIAGKDIDWLNTYGPTEGTIVATIFQPDFDSPLPKYKLPIGKPIDNVRIYLLDSQMQPVPVGVPGELYIAGAGVASGYQNRPDLTAERFLADPFVDSDNPRMYKTGDLARFLPDGNIEYIGRADNQVKVRGFRIELDEIETLLRSHPAVRDAVVLAREDTPGVRRLVAYVIFQQQATATTAELRSFIKNSLPEYMVPAAFVTMETMPLTPSGKINKKALPAPDTVQTERGVSFVEPQTPQEKVLAQIWCEVLGLKQVSIHDNFFELGGDSILSIQVIARANQAGLRLTPRHLFENQTIYQLAAVAPENEEIEINQGPVTGPVQLTPIQKWFFEQDLPEPNHWNQTILLEVHTRLSRPSLEQTFKALLDHHDMLRARYIQTANGWEQTVTEPSGELPLEWHDLSQLNRVEQSRKVEEQSARLQASLNLSKGPLMRMAYFDFGPRSPGRLLMVFHHLVIDGVSWRILNEDFQTAYQQIESGQPVQLPPKTTSFQEWAARLQGFANSKAMLDEALYWRGVSSRNVNQIPVDFPEGANTEESIGMARGGVNQSETHTLLQEVPAAFHVDINVILLTALAQAYRRWSGRPALLIDLEGHGREDVIPGVDISRTIGWFTSLFPVYLELSTDNTTEALKQVKEQIHTIPNNGIGYGLLRYLSEDSELRGQLAACPAPDFSFNYLGQANQPATQEMIFNPAREFFGPVHGLKGKRANLIDITCAVVSGSLQAEFIFSRNIHRQSSVQSLTKYFIEALQQIVSASRNPKTAGYTPSDFPMAKLNQKKLDNLLTKLNQSKGKPTK